MRLWHEDVPAALKAFGERSKKFVVGTACSGSDLVVKVLQALVDHWHQAYKV